MGYEREWLGMTIQVTLDQVEFVLEMQGKLINDLLSRSKEKNNMILLQMQEKIFFSANWIQLMFWGQQQSEQSMIWLIGNKQMVRKHLKGI